MNVRNKLSIVLSICLLLFPVLMVNSAIDPKTAVGVWLFDEGGGDVASDLSGNKHDGKIENTKWVDGKFGKALLFEGNGAVTVQSTDKLNLGNQITMMAYFNTQALSDWHQIIAKNNQYLLRIDPPGEGTKMSAFVNLNGGWEPRASSENIPEKNIWIHLAATYDSGTKKLSLYVNGKLSGESNRDGKPTANNDPVTFGHWGGGSRFRGIIDDVAIFNVALSAADIKSIADNGLKSALKLGVGGTTSVSLSGKLANTWGSIKNSD